MFIDEVFCFSNIHSLIHYCDYQLINYLPHYLHYDNNASASTTAPMEEIDTFFKIFFMSIVIKMCTIVMFLRVNELVYVCIVGGSVCRRRGGGILWLPLI